MNRVASGTYQMGFADVTAPIEIHRQQPVGTEQAGCRDDVMMYPNFGVALYGNAIIASGIERRMTGWAHRGQHA